MKKIINSADREYQPVETQNLVLDAVPTVNSFNGVTSDAVARAVAGASGEVPQVTENDNGKVLKAIYDAGGPAVEWAEAPSGVPEYSAADEGKVLGVVVDDSGDTPVASLDWVDQPADELPSISGNAGKVLKVNSGATGVEWGAVPQELPASLGTAGQVLTVNSGATGVEWATPSGGGSSNVEIIPLSSSAAADIDAFAAAVHTAYAAGKVVVAKLVNADADSIYTMYLPMTKAYEGATTQYFFGGQAMWYNENNYVWSPEEYYMYVCNYGDPHFSAQFNKARPTALSWTPFQ